MSPQIDSSLVRMFAIEYSSEYNNLIRNGVLIDDEFVMKQLNVKKEKSMIRKVIDWFVQVFEGYVRVRELAATQDLLFRNRHLLSDDQIKELEERLEKLKSSL